MKGSKPPRPLDYATSLPDVPLDWSEAKRWWFFAACVVLFAVVVCIVVGGVISWSPLGD